MLGNGLLDMSDCPIAMAKVPVAVFGPLQLTDCRIIIRWSLLGRQ